MIANKFTKLFFKGAVGMGTIYVIAIMALLVVFGATLTKGVNPPQSEPTGSAVTIVPPNPSPGQNNLQLYTFGYTTPAPTVPPIPTSPPGEVCLGTDHVKTPSCGGPCSDFEVVACPATNPGDPAHACTDPGSYVGEFYDKIHVCVYNSDTSGDGRLNMPLDQEPWKSEHEAYLQKLNDPNCVQACYGKPVIYLYPVIPTLVDVKLTIPGRITVSDPLYPTEGWKNILAYPGGKLKYHDKTYNELYYESEVDKAYIPDSGIVIAKADLRIKLTELTKSLGLIPSEQSEFLAYWLPRLNALKSPYILFSVLNSSEKDRVDHVEITPKPQTKIEFLAYFKPQNSSKTNLKPLNLPDSPIRNGFTAVEWGGTIDR